MSQPPEAERDVQSVTDLRRFSCLTCRQRKVRCDRHNPCSNCTKAVLQCSFIPPVRGKPKKRSTAKEGLHAKLRRYEKILKSHGLKIEPPDDGINISDAETVLEPHVEIVARESESPKMTGVNSFALEETKTETKTKLITENGSSRYYDNGLWPNLGDEFHHPVEGGISKNLDESNVQTSALFNGSLRESDLVLNITSKKENLASLHFSLHDLKGLFDIYHDRVDPLMKLLHLPTFWLESTNALKNHRDMTESLEALIFSFCFATIVSLEDDECYSLLGEQKYTMAARYRVATRQALINADFLKSSDMMTLQAYFIFLMSMRGHHQSISMYILSGIAVRLARRMGLHRDGAALGMSPFETEMRRRLWAHIVHVDWRTSEFSGTKPSMDLFLSDTKKPLNIEDEDIGPNMTNFPTERIGITSVILCLLRCEVMDFLRQVKPPFSNEIRWDNLTSPSITLEKKDNMIREMEDMLERKYLRYFDPADPLHHFSSIIARSSVCKMKLHAHNPRQFASLGAKVPQRSRDIIFANGTKLLEYANLMHCNPTLHKFTWQVDQSFFWETLHYVLVEVRHRKTGPEVDRAWQIIGAVFKNYYRIFAEAVDTLYAPLGDWTLRVWDDFVAARRVEEMPELPVPDFIIAIRRRRRPLAENSSKQSSVVDLERVTESSTAYGEVQPLRHDGDLFTDFETTDSYDFSNLLSFDLEPEEWVQWERVISGQAF